MRPSNLKRIKKQYFITVFKNIRSPFARDILYLFTSKGKSQNFGPCFIYRNKHGLRLIINYTILKHANSSI